MKRTTFSQRLGLIIFGLFLGILLLELGLRLGGMILLYYQERANRPLNGGEKSRVIVCLGESTTAGGKGVYPARLENILNDRLNGPRVTVINKGVVGTDSYEVLLRLEEYLDKYQPELVLVMMGANDRPGTEVFVSGTRPSWTRFFRNLRTYKLAMLLREHIEYFLTERSINLLTRDHGRGSSRSAESPGREMERRKAFPLNPREAFDYIALGDWYFDQDRWDEAAWMYNAAIGIDPLLAAAHVKLGVSYREKQEWERADSAFEKAIELDPNNPDVYIERALDYADCRRERREGERWFRKAYEVGREYSRVYREWGMDQLGQLRFEQAEKLLRKALSLAPHDPQTYSSLGLCYRNWGRYKEAAEFYKREAALRPAGAWNMNGLLITYQLAGELEKADKLRDSEAAFLEEAIKFNPATIHNYHRLAELYRKAGKNLEAEEVTRKAEDFYLAALKMNPEGWWLLAELAGHYRYLGKLELAEEYYRSAIAGNPKGWWLYERLAETYGASGRWEEADNSYRLAVQEPSGDPSVWARWAESLIAREEYEKAENVYRQASALFPENTLIYPALAWLYEKMGDKEKAREAFRMAYEVNPLFSGMATPRNYRKLHEMVSARGIQLVCVQYPMLSADPLLEIFRDREGIIFVSNDEIFKKAVGKEGYDEYFKDKFGVYFGHCTPKGDQLLAENIAETLLKEYFH